MQPARRLPFFLMGIGAFLPAALDPFLAALTREASWRRWLGWVRPAHWGVLVWLIVLGYGFALAGARPLSLTVPPLPSRTAKL